VKTNSKILLVLTIRNVKSDPRTFTRGLGEPIRGHSQDNQRRNMGQ